LKGTLALQDGEGGQAGSMMGAGKPLGVIVSGW